MTTIIIVPYRPDNGQRDKLWRHVKRRLTLEQPTWSIVEGRSPDGPFNRSAAINDAAGCDWDTAVITDADCPRELARGAWRYHDLIGYTSVGAGSCIVDVRLNCPPEIVLHRLRCA